MTRVQTCALPILQVKTVRFDGLVVLYSFCYWLLHMYDVLTDFLPCLLPFFLIEKNEDLRTSKCVHYTLLTMKTVALVLVHLHTFLLDFF